MGHAKPVESTCAAERTASRFLRAGLLVLAWLCASAPSPSGDPVAARIQAQIGRLEKSRLAIGGEVISSKAVLPSFYRSREFRAQWTEKRDADELLSFIRGIESDGLNPGDYHLRALETLRPQINTPEERADFDILASDALARVGHHLYLGKVDLSKLDPNWNGRPKVTAKAADDWMQGALGSKGVRASLEAARPARRYYAKLAQALATYRSIEQRGGWPVVPAGVTLREGMRDSRVAAVRRRLAITGDYPGSIARPDSSLFESALTEAVRGFQYRAFLKPDGAVGPGTAKAMSVPVAQRVDQIRVDLERARWVMHDLPPHYVLVNISSAVLFLVQGDTLAWRARCQVGKVARKTPIFRSAMTHMEFNPTWTVPPGIFAKDILPAARRGEPVLERKHLKVIDSKGRVVDPATVKWPARASDFPYMLRQDPGPNNALGRVKFMFPNQHSVYIHDTPSKDLFEHEKRTFSSGCIRVEHPLVLAERLLADPARWNQQTIQETIDAGTTKVVLLKPPIPVLLLYWTVNIDEQGLIRFSDDVYERDARVLEALDEPPPN
jgi:murein L,D-transpeptidase YcbB/YkuD